MRIVHGNTLTAAAVVETSRALFGPAVTDENRMRVFVTGASSNLDQRQKVFFGQRVRVKDGQKNVKDAPLV